MKMSPMDAAWYYIVKATTTRGPGTGITEEEMARKTRQTTLGEHHPKFPSPHGEMTLIRRLSPERLVQVMGEGVKPLPQSEHNELFELSQAENRRGIKRIPTEEDGTWWTLPNAYDMKRVATERGSPADPWVGYRGDPRKLEFMFRGRHQAPEGLNEAMVLSQLPREQLVRLSPMDSYSHQTPASIARYYGLPEGKGYTYELTDSGRWADTVPFAEATNP